MKITDLTTLFFFSLSTLAPTLQAQVTIGANTKPVQGALLELKEKDAEPGNLATSTKGLMMPRVSLTSMTDLYPMFTGAEPDYAALKTSHVGLIVYNSNVCAPTPTGLHVWNGSQWNFLGTEKLSSNVQIYQDQDGNNFKASSFGSAGIWMVENLMAKNYAAGMGGGAVPVHTGSTDYTVEAYAYPNGTTGNWGTAPSVWYKSQGLFYTWAAAAKGNTSIIVDQQVTSVAVGSQEVEMQGPLGTAPNKYVQGICPDGWHLPSDREWNQLEQEIYNNAATYSSVSTSSFNPTVWNVDWGGVSNKLLYMNVRRGSTAEFGHGSAMKNACPVPNTSNETNGKSKIAAQGGFNALLLGYINGNSPTSYSTGGYFWSSSSGSDGAGNAGVSIYRSLNYLSPMVNRGNTGRQFLWSVRCKKNTN